MFKVIVITTLLMGLGLCASAQTKPQLPVPGNERGGSPERRPLPPMPPTPRPIRVAPMLRDSLTPVQKWSPLNAQAHGMFVMDTVQGIPFVGGYAGPGNYRFYYKNDSAVVVYFPSTGQGYNFMKQWAPPGGNGYVADVAQFGKNTQNSWSLSEDAHIVDVEVNGGKGTTGQIHFVPSNTKISVLDSIIQPSKKINAFLQPYSDLNSPANVRIAALLDQLIADKKNNDAAYSEIKDVTAQNKTERGFTLRLSDDESQLKLVYYVNRGFEWSKTTGFMPGPRCRLGRTSVNFGVEFVRTVVQDRSGNILDEEIVTKPYIHKYSSPGLCMPLDPPPVKKCPVGKACSVPMS